MASRVIGVEIEKDLLRAAVVETRLRRFEFVRVFEARLSEGREGEEADDANIGTSMEEVLTRGLGEPLGPGDSLAVLFPGSSVFFRRLSFPFKDENRIAAALPFQMMGQLPALPGDFQCAFERVSRESGETGILAVAVLKESLRAFLQELRTSGLDPTHVSVGGVCLGSFLPYLELGEEVALIVWAGGDRLEMLVARGLRPEIARVVELGEPVTQRGEVSSAAMREVLVTAAGASEAGLSVGSVVVTGESCEALRGPLEEVLGVPCRILDPKNLGLPGAASCEGLGPKAARAVALALGVVAGRGPGTLNLLTGEFARRGTFGLLREKFALLVGVFVLFLALGTARFVGRAMGLHAERAAVMAEVEMLSKQLLGTERTDVAGILKTMKSANLEEIQVFPKWTAVDTLGRLIKAVMDMGASSTAVGESSQAQRGGGGVLGPEDTLAVEIESVRIEPRVVSVRGEADTIETLDGFVQRLKSEPCFREVTTESTERIQFRRHQGWQRFSLHMEVDCSEGERMSVEKEGEGTSHSGGKGGGQ